MSYAICLDQNTPNFNINTLSVNGFSIYANLGNGFITIIAQGIPYTQLFQPPIGTCPYNITLPQGTTQILVVDLCDVSLNIANIFSPENIAAGTITTNCCYAIIDIPQGLPPTFCETCPLTFDTFLAATTGSIIAGNLSSTCGPVTDYTIGWYLNGNYSSPAITSGYGNTFSYQFQHPLTGNSSVPVLAGNWEGIIHDITINGVTYSSVSGSAGGQSIPFESCFDTVVAAPLKCDNGAFQGIAKYTHQINFNSQAVGTTSAPVSLTFALNPTTKYFAYLFDTYYVSDEIEIKWKSGNPNATSNPTLYSQPIYLEKLKRGSDFPLSPLPPQTTPNIPSSQNTVINNVWPKESNTTFFNSFPYGFQRVLTLTSLETSSNALFPDLLEITITPNTTNNNTQWKAAFQCLDNFDCTNCNYSNYPNSLPKISSFYLQKQYGCDAQQLITYYTGCLANSDLINVLDNPLTTLNGSLVGSTGNSFQQSAIASPQSYLPLTPVVNCASQQGGGFNCGSPSTGTITLNKTPQQIQLTFNLYSDYLDYKNSLNSTYLGSFSSITSPVSCSAGSTNLNYYKHFTVTIPVQQSPTANCGDNTVLYNYYFHINDYFNIVYTNDNNPNAASWAITIPQSLMVNCYPNLNCNTCYFSIDGYVNNYNQNVQNPTTFTFTTTVGAKLIDAFTGNNQVWNFQNGVSPSGSACASTINSYRYFDIPWYSTYTIPFIPNPSIPGSWTNLPSLSGSIPCDFSKYPSRDGFNDSGWVYKGYMLGVQVRFPNLTSSFNYSLSTNNFEVYSLTNITATGSQDITPNTFPLPCPEPSGSLIYSYIGGTPTVYSASYFVGGSPTLIIDP
jgi:hypothetical protein